MQIKETAKSNIFLNAALRNAGLLKILKYYKLFDEDVSFNSIKKIMITNDDTDCSTGTVYHDKLRDFLMMENL